MKRRPAGYWISDAGEADLLEILVWSAQSFGPSQASRYADLIFAAIDEIADNPLTALSRDRSDIQPGLRSIHVRRRSRDGRHLVLYRVRQDGAPEIVRVLHDSMDPRHHVADA